MLHQYSEINIKKNKNAFDQIADQFTDLPLYYMSFHGSNEVNKVLGTITYAIENYGVTFIEIDTLQFFLSGQGEGYKKFDMQDYVMSEFRKIATTYNVHIAVVIHPRKTEDNEDIGIHSIYGTSKATQ
jgi:twinkle protein